MKSLLCSILLATSFALAQEADSSAKTSAQELSPFDHLGHNMLGSAFSWPLGFHMLGGALTYRLSMEDKDLMVARFVARQNEIVYGIAFTPGMLMGTFGPFLIPGYMYFISNNKALNNTGAVAAQATTAITPGSLPDAGFTQATSP